MIFQAGNVLVNRVSTLEMSWVKEMGENGKLSNLVASPGLELDLSLDSGPLLKAVQQLNFIQLKREIRIVKYVFPKRS
jgi:hypothetical protein